MFHEIVFTVLIIYIIISVMVYFLANSNVLPYRRYKSYEIGFDAELKYINSVIDQNKQLAYWVAKQENSNKSVILLHGFTRTSDKMQSRAEIYWKEGYNLYFVDNLGHGYSSDLLYPSGYRYSREVKNLIIEKEIDRPVLHGLSMGAIAANVIAQLEPEIVEAIVCEALAYHFNDLYKELLRYLKIPFLLFPWLEWISRKLNWKQFEELGISEEDYKPYNVSSPFFLIHSETDSLFDYKEHFLQIKEKLDGQDTFKSWLVPDSGHTRMQQHPDYEGKLREFLKALQLRRINKTREIR